jgi:hypothetical protein
MAKKDEDKSNDQPKGGHTYDKNYADYKSEITKGGYGEAMTPEQWEAAKDSDD